MKTKTYLLLILLFSIIGLLVSGVLTYAKMFHAIDELCGIETGCTVVQESDYATLFQVEYQGKIITFPLSLVGSVFYGMLSVVSAWLYLRRNIVSLSQYVLYGLFVLTLLSALTSGYLTVVQFFVLRALCTYCLISGGVSLVLFFLLGMLTFSTPMAFREVN